MIRIQGIHPQLENEVLTWKDSRKESVASGNLIPMRCHNCHKEFEGEFCSHCGQLYTANNRLSFADIRRDFFDNVFNVHRGLPFTIWNLLIRPGKVGREYLDGRRKTYTNPVRYLIIALAIQAFVDYWFIRPDLNEQPDFFEFAFLSDQLNHQMAIWNHVLATKFALIHNLTMIVVFPSIFLFLFRKQGYNFTELLTVNFYYFSTGLILTISTIFLAYQAGFELPIQGILLATLGYVVWSSMRFFREESFWIRTVKVSIAVLIFMVVRVFFLVFVMSLLFPIS